jgi:Ca2+-binding RTX toxin-like protein
MLRQAIFLMAVLAAVAAGASPAQPTRRAQTAFVASYDVVLEGGISRSKHSDSQASNPQDSVIVQSDDAYQGRGLVTLKEEANGQLVQSSSSFAYQSATWHLSGQNGTNGSFDCNPPVQTTDGIVKASGWVVGGVLYVRFLLSGAEEHNDKYDCGANFSGFATDSEYEAESLLAVEDNLPGSKIATSADHPAVGTLVDVEDTGTAPNTKHSDARWTITITKRSGSKNDDGPPGPNTSTGPTSGTRHVCTITGTRRNDVLVGTSGDDVICGLGGNDRIDGRGGNDLVYGGLGKDTFAAVDKTVDRVDGGPGKDKGTFDRSPRDKVARVERAVYK